MKGYFQLALGRKYIEESVQFISSIRAFGDDLPVSILVKKEDHEYALSRNIFDHVIIFSENEPLFGLCRNTHEEYCIFPRLKLLDYIPYRDYVRATLFNSLDKGENILKIFLNRFLAN